MSSDVRASCLESCRFDIYQVVDYLVHHGSSSLGPSRLSSLELLVDSSYAASLVEVSHDETSSSTQLDYLQDVDVGFGSAVTHGGSVLQLWTY